MAAFSRTRANWFILFVSVLGAFISIKLSAASRIASASISFPGALNSKNILGEWVGYVRGYSIGFALEVDTPTSARLSITDKTTSVNYTCSVTPRQDGYVLFWCSNSGNSSNIQLLSTRTSFDYAGGLDVRMSEYSSPGEVLIKEYSNAVMFPVEKDGYSYLSHISELISRSKVSLMTFHPK
jgi:hypothetical protein